MKAVTYAVAALLTVLLASITGGWALSVLWGWFVIPVFGVSPIGVPAAMGLTLTAQLILRPDYKTEPDVDAAELFGKTVAVGFIAPLFVVFLGWVLHSFV